MMKTCFLLFFYTFWCSVCQASDPIEVTIVPEHRTQLSATIEHSKSFNHPFYVILTNLTNEPLSVFETSNSWGYYAISFEAVLGDGSKHILKLKPAFFTVNVPTTYLIFPGAHQVFPISLDESWENIWEVVDPANHKATLTAIYSVQSSPESKTLHALEGQFKSRPLEIEIAHH